MMQTLKVDKSIPFQSRVETLPFSERFAAPLAPVAEKSRKPASHKVVHVPKHHPGIPIAKIGGPPSESHIHFLYDPFEGLLVSTHGFPTDLVLESLDRLPGGEHIQILSVPPFQIAVIAEGKSQKVQLDSPIVHL